MEKKSSISSGILFIIILINFYSKAQDLLNPSFEAKYLTTNLIELTIYLKSDTTLYDIIISSLPAADGSLDKLYETKTIKTNNKQKIVTFALNNYDLFANAGKILVQYKPQKENSTYSDTTIFIRELNLIFTDVGILFTFGKDGIIKGYPTISIAAYSKPVKWVTLFTELNLNAIAPIDSSKQAQNFYPIFAEGGAVLDIQAGVSFYPWYEEWEQEVIAPFVAYGLRTYNNPDLEYVDRWMFGMTIEIYPLTGDFDDGYLDVGYAYDRFWDIKDNNSYNPNRLFFKGHLDFDLPGTDKYASLELKVDAPANGKGYGSLGIYFIVNIDLPQLAENVFDSLFGIWGNK